MGSSSGPEIEEVVSKWAQAVRNEDLDLITYYYNVRVVWFSDGQAMQLAVLGFDGSNQTSAGRISAALLALCNQPPGTIDPLTHLDADSLNLLNMDPFCNGQVKCDAIVVLSGPRFIPIRSFPDLVWRLCS